MNNKSLPLIFILIALLSPVIFSQVPPPPPPPSQTESVEVTAEEADLSIMSRFINLQADGAAYINRLMKDLRDGFHFTTFLTVILFSLAYGVFHTIGPGHGKLIIVSYFMQKERKVEDALALSVIISLIHASGAIILALLFRTVLTGIRGAERIVFQYSFTVFSGLLLIGLGLFYLIKRFRGEETHKHNEVQISKKNEKKGIWTRNLAAGFSIGVVPCPLSLTIMTISIVSGIFWVGMTSVIALTLSMATVLFGISYYTIKTRNLTVNSPKEHKHSKLGEKLPVLFSYVGTASMIILGSYITYKGFLSISIWKG